MKPPRVVSIGRARDEQILRWLAMRARGKSTTDIARYDGIAAATRISEATAAVRDADIAESGEPEATVRAAYKWRKNTGLMA